MASAKAIQAYKHVKGVAMNNAAQGNLEDASAGLHKRIIQAIDEPTLANLAQAKLAMQELVKAFVKFVEAI